jgi:hypothetical protein
MSVPVGLAWGRPPSSWTAGESAPGIGGFPDACDVRGSLPARAVRGSANAAHWLGRPGAGAR